jgi:medium-chain acyl-[acyl-carrier-protein] hydrolase
VAERLARRGSFPVHTYEVDAFGTLEVPALSGYLQEVAGLHAADLGVGIDVLRAKGLTWVLARQRLELPLPVSLGDTLEIETWPSGVERLAATREFVVRRGDGAEAARATTQWYVLDLASRRPVRPGEVLDPRFPRPASPHVAPLAPGKLPAPASWDLEKRFQVRYADIDVNMHVTNASYVTWAIEAAPVELWRAARVASVEVHYLAEGLHGHAILSRLARTGEATYAHAIVREDDGKELARLVTGWVPRDPNRQQAQ